MNNNHFRQQQMMNQQRHTQMMQNHHRQITQNAMDTSRRIHQQNMQNHQRNIQQAMDNNRRIQAENSRRLHEQSQAHHKRVMDEHYRSIHRTQQQQHDEAMRRLRSSNLNSTPHSTIVFTSAPVNTLYVPLLIDVSPYSGPTIPSSTLSREYGYIVFSDNSKYLAAMLQAFLAVMFIGFPPLALLFLYWSYTCKGRYILFEELKAEIQFGAKRFLTGKISVDKRIPFSDIVDFELIMGNPNIYFANTDIYVKTKNGELHQICNDPSSVQERRLGELREWLARIKGVPVVQQPPPSSNNIYTPPPPVPPTNIPQPEYAPNSTDPQVDQSDESDEFDSI